MSRNVYLTISALGCGAVYLALAQSSSPIPGHWTVGGPVVQDKVQLTIRRSTGKSNMSSSSAAPLNHLRGLTRAQLDSSGSVVRFELVREAGTLRFEGYLRNGGGGGAFTFSPNPSFDGEMRALGYSGLTDEKVFVIAVHDVSAAYVRDMNALGI